MVNIKKYQLKNKDLDYTCSSDFFLTESDLSYQHNDIIFLKSVTCILPLETYFIAFKVGAGTLHQDIKWD